MTQHITDADLSGRVALVVGGTGRIGSAVCRDLAARGAHVVVGYRRVSGVADRIAAEVGGTAIRLDTADEASLSNAFALIESTLGVVSLLVDTAHPESDAVAVADLDNDVLGAQLDAVRGYAALIRQAVPGMRALGWGRIVYVSGALMSRPAVGLGAYGAAKAAATTLTRYLALEEGRAGITANVVAPGRVFDPAEELDDLHRELSGRLLERTALGRFPDAAEVAATIGLLLVTPQLTGQTLWVTGGEPIIA